MQPRDPTKISSEVIHEILVRLLINLPAEEKQFPRILNNIKEACWFYGDHFCTNEPILDNKFREKFAKRIFEHWATLKPELPFLKEKWEEYRIYMSQIPSNGALIFDTTLNKLLFIIYHNPRERTVRKLDFPKGKVDQGEDQIECAIREIREETGLLLQDNINQ